MSLLESQELLDCLFQAGQRSLFEITKGWWNGKSDSELESEGPVGSLGRLGWLSIVNEGICPRCSESQRSKNRRSTLINKKEPFSFCYAFVT